MLIRAAIRLTAWLSHQDQTYSLHRHRSGDVYVPTSSHKSRWQTLVACSS